MSRDHSVHRHVFLDVPGAADCRRREVEEQAAHVGEAGEFVRSVNGSQSHESDTRWVVPLTHVASAANPVLLVPLGTSGGRVPNEQCDENPQKKQHLAKCVMCVMNVHTSRNSPSSNQTEWNTKVQRQQATMTIQLTLPPCNPASCVCWRALGSSPWQ